MGLNKLEIAEAYYKALGEKQLAATEKHLDPDVQCTGPLVKVLGKESVMEANKKFVSLFKTLKIRSSFASHDQAMIVYDLGCQPPINIFSAAALLTFKGSLITKIELFYDARPFDAQKAATS